MLSSRKPLTVGKSGTRKEELLVEKDKLSKMWVLRRILMPHLYPALGAGAAIAFFQSIENFNVTQFTRGGADTLTVYVFSKVRSGITPTINALAFLLILVTLVLAIFYELNRRRLARIEAAREAEARRAEALEEAI